MTLELKNYILKTYDSLHEIPEGPLIEFKTSNFIDRELKKLGYSTTKNIGHETALMSTIDSGNPGPHLGIRADMDALKFQGEKGEYYNHACGHDAHMAMVLGVAYALKSCLPKRGKLSFIFQPAEETLEGAKKIIKSSFIDDIDEMIGIHLMAKNEIPMGHATPALIHGSIWTLKVSIYGLNAHGARPHLGINAIDAGLMLVQGLNSLHFDPKIPHSIKVTGFNAGGLTSNLIPDKAELIIDIRAQTNELMDEILNTIQKTIEFSAQSLGAKSTIDSAHGVPAAKHDPKLVAETRAAIEEVLSCSLDPYFTVGGEDFHFYSNELGIKTSYIGLGCDLEPCLHNPQMVFNKDALLNGTKIMTQLVKNKLF